MILASLACATTFAAAGDYWRQKFDDFDRSVQGGNGYAAQPNNYYWGESYLLQSYMAMYETYRDRVYLDKIVSQFDQMTANLHDRNGDGRPGWDTADYSVEKTSNGNFEDAGYDPAEPSSIANGGFDSAGVDAALPSSWQRWQSTPATAYRSLAAGEAMAGSAGLVVKTDPAHGWQAVEQALSTYTALGEHIVSFYGRTNGVSPGAVDVIDATDGIQVLGSASFSETSWTRHAFYFTAPVPGRSLKLRCRSSNYTVVGAAAFFDEVSVQPALSSEPDGWLRWQSSAATAYRSTATAERQGGAGAAGLVVKTDPAHGWQVVEQVLPSGYVTGGVYRASFYGRTNGVVSGRLDVVDVSDNNRVLVSELFSGTSWQFLQAYFTAPAVAGHTLKVRCTHADYTISGGVAYFDYLKVRLSSEYLVHEGMILYPIARFARIVRKDPALWAAYKAKADSYLDLIEGRFVPKWASYWWEAPGASPPRGTYLIPDDETLNSSTYYPAGGTLPHNQYLAFARLLLELYRVTGNPSYLDKAAKMGETFKANLRVNVATPTAILWNYSDALKAEDGLRWSSLEDSSHANLDIGTAVELYNAGRVFTSAEMRKFSSTFLDAMWNGSDDAPAFGDAVDVSTGNAYGAVLGGWSQLAQFDPRVWRLAQKIFRTNPLDSGHQFLTLAQIAAWNPEHVLNRDLEYFDSDDPTLPAFWRRWQSTALTAYRSTAASDVYDGDAGLVVKTDPAHGWQVIEQAFSYSPGMTYGVSFFGKTNGVVGGHVDVLDEGNGELGGASFIGTAWQAKAFTFTAPDQPGHTLKIRCRHDDYRVAGGVAACDRFRLTSPAASLTTPPEPRPFSLVAASSLRANWAANGSPAGTQYAAELSSDSFSAAASSTTFNTFALFSGLTPNTRYEARVLSALPPDPPSAPVALGSAVTPANPPVGAALSQVFTTSCTVSWNANANPAGTRYVVDAWNPRGSTRTWTTTAAVLAAKGLDGGSTYYFHIRAENLDGIPTVEAALSTITRGVSASSATIRRELSTVVEHTGPFGAIRAELQARTFPMDVGLTLSSLDSVPGGASRTADLRGLGVNVKVELEQSVQPARPVFISLSYADADLEGFDESRFVLARHDPATSSWVLLPSRVDILNKTVTGTTDHLSLFQIMQSNPSATVTAVKAYPNPLRPALGHTGMTFSSLPSGARLRIYTLAGEKVKDLSASAAGVASWDGTNEDGRNVASGVYFVFGQSGGEKITFKVAVQR